MKTKLIALLMGLILGMNALFGGEKESIQTISKTITSLHQENHRVWDGYDLTITPLIITFPNGHIYAFNYQSRNPVWKEQEIDGRKVLYTEQDQWGLSGVAMQDNFLIEGQEAFVFNIGLMQQAPMPAQMPFLVMVHELFHRYQFANFAKDEDMGNYVDQQNPDNLALMEIEELTLMHFLADEGDKKLEHLKDFVAVNTTRTKLLQDSSKRWEEHQQKMEGLADYASIRTYDAFAVLPHFSGEIHLLGILRGYVQNADITERAVKWRHYGVGAALGYALDYVQAPEWKAQIQSGSESQTGILSKRLKLSADEVKARTQKVKKKFGYNKIRKRVAVQVEDYKQLLADIHEDYEKLEGVAIKLNKPSNVPVNGGGSTNGIYSLPEGHTVSIRDASVSSTSDKSWELESKGTPFLFQNQEGARMFKLDAADISIDGKKYLIHELMAQPREIAFKNLSWDCGSSRFESKDLEGVLRVTNGHLEVVYQ